VLAGGIEERTMNMNPANTTQQTSRVQLFACILVGLLMIIALQPAHADEEFNAYETVREAKIGVWADDTTSDISEDTTEVYVEPVAVKSETIYVDGKAVCFKMESNVSVAYYCNN
jgi:hypothetical protein